MAWPIYSERLVIASTKGSWTYYTVPAGKRAVVRSVSAYNSAATASVAAASVAGASIFRVSLQATTGYDTREFRHVAYAGELVGALVQETGMVCIVSGYLFNSPIGALGAPGEVFEVPETPDQPFARASDAHV